MFRFCWEQKAFLYINTPFHLLSSLVLLILRPIYAILALLRLPMLFFVLALSLVWVLLLGIITPLAWLSRHVMVLRPVLFVVALPFLIVAHFLNSISPSMTPNDALAKYPKWEFIEGYPFCSFPDLPSESAE